MFHFIVLCDKELTTCPGALFLFILSQIWLLGNTELRSKLANSCSPGSGRQGFEENHHVAYVFYASEKQIKSFLVFFWDSDNHAHFLGALPDAHGCRCASTEPTFCLFTFLPEALISLDLTTHSLPRFSPHRFILHAAVRLTILKHVFFFFYRSLPLSEKLQPFSVYYEMKFKYGIKYPPKQAPQYFSSSSLFWIFSSNEGLLIYLPTFHLFIH